MKKIITILMLVMFASLAFGQLDNELIRACENEIIRVTQNQYEMAIVLSADGDILLKKLGTRSQVNFTAAERELIYGAAVVIHNHPSSGGLSPQDMAFAIEYNIREMRALAVNGMYGYGSWVMINERSRDRLDAEFASTVFYQRMNYSYVHKYVEYIEKMEDRFIEYDLAKYVIVQLEWMQVAQFSDYYKSGRMTFYYELWNLECIQFDTLPYILGAELDL